MADSFCIVVFWVVWMGTNNYGVQSRSRSMFPRNPAMHVPECMALLLLRFQYDIGRVVAIKTVLRTAA